MEAACALLSKPNCGAVSTHSAMVLIAAICDGVSARTWASVSAPVGGNGAGDGVGAGIGAGAGAGEGEGACDRAGVPAPLSLEDEPDKLNSPSQTLPTRPS